MANTVFPLTCQSHMMWTVVWRGGTLFATSPHRLWVDKRPLTLDWFPIERLMDSPVLHVFAFKKKRFGIEDKSEDERRLLQQKFEKEGNAVGFTFKKICGGWKPGFIIWGHFPWSNSYIQSRNLLCTLNSKKWLSSPLFTTMMEVNRSDFIYITPSMTRSGDHHILRLHPQVWPTASLETTHNYHSFRYPQYERNTMAVFLGPLVEKHRPTYWYTLYINIHCSSLKRQNQKVFLSHSFYACIIYKHWTKGTYIICQCSTDASCMAHS